MSFLKIVSIAKYGVSEFVSRLAPVFSSFFLARQLDPGEFGRLALIVVLNEIIFLVVSNNLHASIRLEYFSRNFSALREFISSCLVYSLIVALCFLFLLLIIGAYFQIYVIILIVFIALSRTVSMSLLALFQCRKLSDDYLVVQAVYLSAFIFALLLFANRGFSAWIYAMLIATFLQATTALFIGKKRRIRLVRDKVLKPTLDNIFHGLSFMPQAVGWWAKSGLDRYFISIFFSSAVLGSYVLAYQFSSILLLVSGALNLAFVPELAKATKLKTFEKNNVLYAWSCFFLVAAAVIVMFFAQIVLTRYYANYSGSESYLPWLLVSALPHSLILIFVNELYYLNQRVFVSRVVFFVFVGQGIVNLILAAYLSVFAMIFASIFINAILLCLVVLKIWRVRRNNREGVF